VSAAPTLSLPVVFIGHFAAGFALHRRVRQAPLGVVLLGTALLDLLHGVYRLAGVEHVVVHEPAIFANWELVEIGFSHSLLVSLLYAATAAALAGRWWGSRAIGAAVGAAVFSHYVLDVLTHHADMPVVGLGAAADLKVGTDLAAHPLPFFLVELGWCLAAWALYDTGNRRLLATLLVLLAVWANNVFGFSLPPIPPESALHAALPLIGFGVAGTALLWAARPVPLP
jgi:hypothetical protein